MGKKQRKKSGKAGSGSAGKGAFHRAKKTAKLASVSLAIGGLIGVTVGLLTAPKKGKELRSDLQQEGERLWKQLKKSKKDVEKIVTKVFGEVSPETLRVYTKAKSEILARVAKYKDSMTKKRYDEIVDSVTKRVTSSKKLKKSLPALKKEFKNTWKDIKKLI